MTFIEYLLCATTHSWPKTIRLSIISPEKKKKIGHWLSWNSLSLADLLSGKKRTFFFLLGSTIIVGFESSPPWSPHYLIKVSVDSCYDFHNVIEYFIWIILFNPQQLSEWVSTVTPIL